MTSIPIETVAELSTVASRYAVVHDGARARRFDDLEPATDHEIGGFAFRTLPEPGELLATFATTNDVHFGEVECGRVTGSDVGPVFSAEPGEPPYPVVMNEGAVTEIAALDPDAVVVKGDLTSDGTDEEYQAFLDVYEPAFGDRLYHVRGNHESYHHSQNGARATQEIVLPGVRLALIDTSLDGVEYGGVSDEQLDWLDALAADSDRPVVVLGHHHVWNPSSAERPERYFGVRTDDSERLVDVVARRPVIASYLCGHTHRNRVRRYAATGDVPWAEVSAVKDYPGAWAEYRVHEGGIVQVFHRISSSDALTWTEKTRHMFSGLYAGYAFGALADRCFTIAT